MYFELNANLLNSLLVHYLIHIRVDRPLYPAYTQVYCLHALND